MPLEFEAIDAETGAFGYTEDRYAGLLARLNDILDLHETDELSDTKYLAALQDLLAQAPDLIDAHAQVAFHWHRLGKPKKALDSALAGLAVADRQVLEGYAGRIEWFDIDNRAYLRLMHAAVLGYTRLRRHKDAVALIDQMLLANPNDNQGVRYLLGSEMLRAWRFGTAEQRDRVVSVLLEHADTHPPYWYELGLAHLQRYRYVDAATALRRGFAANPYIAEMLGGNPQPAPLTIWHAGDEATPQAAADYVAAYGHTWDDNITHLPYVRWLFNHPEVMIERASVMACREALLWEGDVDKRGELFSRMDELTDGIDDSLSAAIVTQRKAVGGEPARPWEAHRAIARFAF